MNHWIIDLMVCGSVKLAQLVLFLLQLGRELEAELRAARHQALRHLALRLVQQLPYPPARKVKSAPRKPA